MLARIEDAIQWALEAMKKDGLENVRAEPVKVPHWVRGKESVQIVSPGTHDLVMLGLGNSVGTPAEGIEAELVVDLLGDDLLQLGEARFEVLARLVELGWPTKKAA